MLVVIAEEDQEQKSCVVTAVVADVCNYVAKHQQASSSGKYNYLHPM